MCGTEQTRPAGGLTLDASMDNADPLLNHDIGAVRIRSAEAPALHRSELAAFIEQEMGRRPKSWAYVHNLQRACILEAPATPEEAGRAEAMFAQAPASPVATDAIAYMQS